MQENNLAKTRRGLLRIKWALCDSSLKDIAIFHVDVYNFKFEPAMDPKTAYRFIEYVDSLRLSMSTDIIRIYLWLENQGISFKMGFVWNRELPIRENLRRMRHPRTLMKIINACRADIEEILKLEDELHRAELRQNINQKGITSAL